MNNFMTNGMIKYVKVQISRNQKYIADQCIVAESFFDRLRGLIGRKSFQSGEGLLIRPCNDIHMWFMSIPIDVIFIKKVNSENNKNFYQVTSIRENIRPWKFFPVVDWSASEVLELPVGTVQRSQVALGDELCIS